VILPPGRARLSTYPAPTGSGAFANTIGTVRVPAVYEDGRFAQAGGLMAYGPSMPDLFWRAATYVNKILKGANPADLPVQQPTKFELIVNVKAAKAIGLTIPESFLARADEVIE
jgi:putative ABC transport system substrate-binding protein